MLKNILEKKPLLSSVYLPALLISLSQGMLLPVLPLYLKTFGISYGLIGLLLATQAIGTLVGDIPAGFVVDRLGKKKAMILGLLCLCSAALAMTWASTVVEIILYRLFAGLGNALWGTSRHAFLAGATSSSQRGRAIALFGGTGRVGSLIGPVVGGSVGAAFGLTAPFFMYAALGIVTAICITLFLSESAKTGKSLEQKTVNERSTKKYGKVLISAGLGQVCASIIRSGRQVIVPLYASDVIGLELQSIGLIMSIGAALDMSMFYPAGILMDRFGRKYAIVPSFFIQALGMALIPVTATYGGLLMMVCVIGFGNGLGSGTMMTLGADLAPQGKVSEFIGIWRFIGDSGRASGPLVVGSVASLIGLSVSAFFLSGIGVVAAFMLGVMVPETRDTRA